MNLVLCFAFDDPGHVHLRPQGGIGPHVTLCGKRALPVALSRRLVTCADCKTKKPRVLGGA